ncbi:hypothetical protein HY357_01995 [Candidatus Roizmanbacteria bacterium]|nr:hypothetical protein [Candidatus Roizmanbacteria bacterium]
MYIKKSVILLGILIPILTIFLIGEYIYLDNKFSVDSVRITNNESFKSDKNEIKKNNVPESNQINEDVIGVSNNLSNTPVPTVTPALNIQEVQNYLNSLLSLKPVWQEAKERISSEDFNFLMDSFDRQINFCQTIIDHLSKNPNPSDDDLILWQGVQKMWNETGELTNKLNKDLSKPP